ncbi:MAG: glycosyltransferase [Gammaproteobacteria bacterium]
MIANNIKLGIIGVPDNVHLKRRLAKIDKKIYDVTVVCPTYFANELFNDIKVFSVDLNKFKYFRHFQLFFKYASFIKKQDFDIVYCFGALSPLSWLAGLLSEKYLVVGTIGVDVFLDDQINMSSIIKKNIKELLCSADLVTTLSMCMENKLLEYFAIPKKKILKDFLDIEDIWYKKESLISKMEFQNVHPIIFSPRILRPLYQQVEIIKALLLIKNRYPNVLLIQSTFLMDLKYFEYCKNIMKSLQLESNVLFLDEYKESTELINFFDLSDLIIMIPKSDGMPSSMIEAWARKKPVIVSNIENYDTAWNKKLFLKTDISEEAITKSVFELIENTDLKNKILIESELFLKNKREESKEIKIFQDACFHIKKSWTSKMWRLGLFMVFLFEPHFNKLLKT